MLDFPVFPGHWTLNCWRLSALLKGTLMVALHAGWTIHHLLSQPFFFANHSKLCFKLANIQFQSSSSNTCSMMNNFIAQSEPVAFVRSSRIISRGTLSIVYMFEQKERFLVEKILKSSINIQFVVFGPSWYFLVFCIFVKKKKTHFRIKIRSQYPKGDQFKLWRWFKNQPQKNTMKV